MTNHRPLVAVILLCTVHCGSEASDPGELAEQSVARASEAEQRRLLHLEQSAVQYQAEWSWRLAANANARLDQQIEQEAFEGPKR